MGTIIIVELCPHPLEDGNVHHCLYCPNRALSSLFCSISAIHYISFREFSCLLFSALSRGPPAWICSLAAGAALFRAYLTTSNWISRHYYFVYTLALSPELLPKSSICKSSPGDYCDLLLYSTLRWILIFWAGELELIWFAWWSDATVNGFAVFNEPASDIRSSFTWQWQLLPPLCLGGWERWRKSNKPWSK